MLIRTPMIPQQIASLAGRHCRQMRANLDIAERVAILNGRMHSYRKPHERRSVEVTV